MRIIGGQWRGRRLFAPEGMETRPTSDKVREALFNIIRNDVFDARIWDVFAGSGALALEALSRGAEAAVIADNARQAMQVIERNARNVAGQDFDRRVRLIRADYRAAIERAGIGFDLVFLDPPYRMTEAYGDALARLMKADMLSPGCLIVMERHKGAQIPLPRAVDVFDTRQYGDTAVDFAEIRPAEDGDCHDTL